MVSSRHLSATSVHSGMCGPRLLSRQIPNETRWQIRQQSSGLAVTSHTWQRPLLCRFNAFEMSIYHRLFIPISISVNAAGRVGCVLPPGTGRWPRRPILSAGPTPPINRPDLWAAFRLGPPAWGWRLCTFSVTFGPGIPRSLGLSSSPTDLLWASICRWRGFSVDLESWKGIKVMVYFHWKGI